MLPVPGWRNARPGRQRAIADFVAGGQFDAELDAPDIAHQRGLAGGLGRASPKRLKFTIPDGDRCPLGDMAMGRG